MKVRQLVEITVDTELFGDLPEYMQQAADEGWGADDPANGVWYLAQAIAEEYSNPQGGIEIEVLP